MRTGKLLYELRRQHKLAVRVSEQAKFLHNRERAIGRANGLRRAIKMIEHELKVEKYA